MLRKIAVASVFIAASANLHASNKCEFLDLVEPNMIRARAQFYLEVLEKNKTLEKAKGTVFWHLEAQKVTTLKMAEEKLTPGQLKALSDAGCEPWQGAAFTMYMDANLTGSAFRIFSESATPDEAREKLKRLAAVIKLTQIPPDLKATR